MIASKARFGLSLKGQYTTFDDLNELLSSIWIQRLWTYQEILLASNPVVVCGNSHIIWYHFERSLLFLELSAFFDDHGITRQWTSVALSRERLQDSRFGTPHETFDLQLYSDYIKRISMGWEKLFMSIMYFYMFCAFALATVLGIAGRRVPPSLLNWARASGGLTLCVFAFVLLERYTSSKQ